MSKDFIRKVLRENLLKEEMVSFIDKWRENKSFIAKDSVMTTLIAKDNQNGNKLYLFVGLVPRNGGYSDYTYSFMLTDSDNKALTKYMTFRNEVAKYIPNDIKNKKQIFPIIIELTREILRKMTPQEIHRKMVEPLVGDSTIRYDEITKIMVNEFGYKDVTTPELKQQNIWKLVKNESNDKNSSLDEEYVLGYGTLLANYLEGIKEMGDKVVKALQEGRIK